MDKLRDAEKAFREEVKNKLERTESQNDFPSGTNKTESISNEKENEVALVKRRDETKISDDDESIPPELVELDDEYDINFKSDNTRLQHWLQLTYEIERRAFSKKQKEVRDQFKKAKEMVKLNKLCC